VSKITYILDHPEGGRSQQLFAEEKYAIAYRTLMPLANDPHNRSDDNPAIKLLAEIQQKLEQQSETK
jgi:hypothetical protein